MRTELMNDDGTIQVEGRTVHLTPNPDATAFADEEIRRASVEDAARTGDRDLATRLAAVPVLAHDESAFRVHFVTPDTAADEGILEALGDLAWGTDGRQAPWLSERTYLVDGAVMQGAREPFVTEEDRMVAAELVASVDGLSSEQRRRLLRRISETPIAARA